MLTNADIQAMVDSVIANDGRLQGAGNVAQKLIANGMNVNALRTNSTLRKDEWKHYDEAIIREARIRLPMVSLLKNAGLTYSLGGNGMARTILEYEDLNEFNDAQMSMDGLSRGDNDRPVYSLKGLPLPITHKDYDINARALASSRMRGEALDTTSAELATRKVAELLEQTLVTGSSSYAFGGYTIYGLTDFPYRNSVTLSLAWDDASKTGANIITDVSNMKQASIDDRHYGPWILVIPTGYETKLDADYDTTRGNTIRQRILAIEGISAVVVCDKLTADNVLLVQMTPDNIRMVEGLGITNVQWDSQGKLVFSFKVMTIQVPQIRADQQNRSGIIHLA